MSSKYIFLAVVLALGVIGAIYLLPQGGNVEVDDHSDSGAKEHEIYPGDVVKKIQNGEDIILLDVRTPEEYAEVHLENALLLPVQELSEESLASIGLGEETKDKEIIIYCRSGARSQTAYNIMDSLGYTNIKSVAGGMIHWEEDGYPFTETGEHEGESTGISVGENDISGPKIVLDRTLHDFGFITQYGGIVETEFEVRNEGNETLKVGNITTSCSCTSAEIASSEIGAGGSAILTVRFDPDFHEEPAGVFKRTVFVPTNDPTVPEAEVAIQVDIEEGK